MNPLLQTIARLSRRIEIARFFHESDAAALADLRAIRNGQVERRDVIVARDDSNRLAFHASPAKKSAYRAQAASLTARLARLPRGDRGARRAAERAVQKAEKRS